MDILSATFMQRALVEAVLIGGICAVVGVYVILNGLSFIGAGISHATFGGIALGLFLGVDPVAAALLFCTGVALAIGVVSERGAVSHDTAVGIFFAATMALGVLLVGLMRGYVPDLFGYLFGNILAVTRGDLAGSAVMAVAVLAAVAAWYKELLAVSFDAEMAAVMGLV
jgi:ABC-type Mn2+/Zn2+ transport system permease subunit